MSENNRKNILYILGAGASAGALPVVSEMKERMNIFCLNVLMSQNITNYKTIDKDNYKFIDIDYLCDFITAIEERRSFDTYAKEIYLKIDNILNKNISEYKLEYKKLKVILKSYLGWEESHSSIDSENRLWILEKYRGHDYYKFTLINDVNILNNILLKYKINNNSEVISEDWVKPLELINGDIEDKNNISTFLKRKIIENGIKELFRFALDKNNPEYIYFVNNKNDIDQRYINFLVDIMGDPSSLEKIKIYSWNYDTQLDLARESLGINNVDKKQKDGQLEILENMEVKINGSIADKEIKFAWEHGNDFTFLKFEENEEWFKNVTDIVIIGYSFPFSNRRTDLRILSSIIRSFPKQYNIYIQTLDEESFNNIKESIGSLVNEITYTWSGGYNWEDYVKIIPKYDKTSFFIPPHY